MRMPGPEGELGHAEIRIGDSRVMLSDERDLKRVADVLLGLDRPALGRLLEAGGLLEVKDG